MLLLLRSSGGGPVVHTATAALSASASVVSGQYVERVREAFDSWPSGSLAASTGYGSQGFVTGPGAVATVVTSPWSGQALQVGPSAYGDVRRTGVGLGPQWTTRFYYTTTGTGTATHYAAGWGVSGTTHVWLAVTTGGQIQIRNSAFSSPLSGRSSYTVTSGSQFRVELEYAPTVGVTARLYFDGNVDGATPDEVLTHTVTDTPGLAGLSFNEVRFGSNGSDGRTAQFDNVRVTDVLSSADPATSSATTHSATAALSATAGLSVSGVVTDVGGAPLSAAAGLSASASVTRPATAALAASAGLTATGVPVRIGDASQTVTGALSASASVTRAASTSLTVTAGLSASAAVGSPSLPTTVTAGLSAAASVTRVGSTSSSVTAGLTAAGSVARVGSASLGAAADLTGALSITRPATASLAASAGLTATAEGVRTGGSAQAVTAALSASATVVEYVATTLRPDDGSTTRPVGGATSRPDAGGILRPSTGVTTRPDTGLVLRP